VRVDTHPTARRAAGSPKEDVLSKGTEDRLFAYVADFVQAGQQDPVATFLIYVPNLVTWRAVMEVSSTYNHFRPQDCAETIEPLFLAASGMRFGQNVGAVIEADFAYYEGQELGAPRGSSLGREFTIAERVEMAEKWLAWGREMRADSLMVKQSGIDGFTSAGAGRGPTGIHFWWD
jgi:hypothetical protein